jgi:hypothetical protein
LLRIDHGFAGLGIDHPVAFERPVQQFVILDGAVGDDRGGDVEHQRRLLARGNRDRQRIGAEQRLGAAGERHVVGIGHGRIDADHVGLERQRGVDAGSSGVAGIAAADPGDAVLAREFDRRFRRLGDDEMAHAVVAIDQRGGRRRARHRDIGPRIGRAELEALHVLRQAEDAMGVGTDEVGLQHQLGDLASIGRRHAGFLHSVDDKTGDRRGRHAAGFWRRLHVHGYFPVNIFSALPLRIAFLSASEIFNDRT